MLGGSKREAASYRRRRCRLAGGRRLGGGGTPWSGDERGDSGSFAQAEQICAQDGGEEDGRAGDRFECGYGAVGVRIGRRFQSPARGTVPGAVLGVRGEAGDRIEQGGYLRE